MADVANPQGQASPAPAPGPAPTRLRTATAAALLALYVGLTVAMMFYFSGQGAPIWEHTLLIYNGFNAFAVAAGGVLLGTQIQQSKVNAAKEEADTAKQETARVKNAAKEAFVAAHAAPADAGDASEALSRARLSLAEIL